mgnify:CR=1 FL=1
MVLQEGICESDLLAAMGAFAASRRPFVVPSVQLTCLSGFMALVPAQPCEMLQDLADKGFVTEARAALNKESAP